MILAQYEIPLPMDYDMDIIRQRVAERGGALDDRAGLGLKAYLIRDAAEGSPANVYAPFYLWREPDALADFHWGGGGFTGIVRDFGRPAVHTWLGGSFTPGRAFEHAPTHALRRVRGLGPDADPADVAVTLVETGRSDLQREGLHSHAWGINPTTWRSVEFTLLSEAPEDRDPDVTCYRVLHMSTPEMRELRPRVGRAAARPW